MVEQEKCLKRKVCMCMCHTLYVDSLFVVLTYIYIIISIFFSTPNDKKKNDDETKEQSSKKRKVCMCMCHTLYADSLFVVLTYIYIIISIFFLPPILLLSQHGKDKEEKGML